MTQIKIDISNITKNEVAIGDNTSVDKTLIFKTSDNEALSPKIQWTASENKFQFSNNGVSFEDITSDHNELTNINGGSYIDGYYHLDGYEYTWLTDGYNDGYWIESKGGTGQTTYTEGDILYADNNNSLIKLTIGTAGQFLRTDGYAPIWNTPVYTNTSHRIAVGKIGVLSNNTDGYLLPSFEESSDENFPAAIIGFVGSNKTIENLTVYAMTAPEAGQTVDIIVRVNNVDTPLAVQLTDSSGSLVYDTSTIIPVNGSDKINVRFVSSATAGVKDIFVNFDLLAY